MLDVQQPLLKNQREVAVGRVNELGAARNEDLQAIAASVGSPERSDASI
jgi:hypothetical protein